MNNKMKMNDENINNVIMLYMTIKWNKEHDNDNKNKNIVSKGEKFVQTSLEYCFWIFNSINKIHQQYLILQIPN